MIAAAFFAFMAGVLAGLVVCKTWRLSVPADIALATLSAVAMLQAAYIADHMESSVVLLAAGVGYVAAAAAGRIVKP